MVPLVRAKKLAPWLLPPHMAELAAAPDVATTEPVKLQIMCVSCTASVNDDAHPFLVSSHTNTQRLHPAVGVSKSQKSC